MYSREPQILYVDDDEDSCQMMKVLLSLADKTYSVTCVNDGNQAMKLIAAQTFDLYLLDIWLPGMSGLQLSRWIRETNASIPIVFFSAVSRPVDRENAFNAGGDVFLVKPNELDQVLPTVKRLLEQKTASASAN